MRDFLALPLRSAPVPRRLTSSASRTRAKQSGTCSGSAPPRRRRRSRARCRRCALRPPRGPGAAARIPLTDPPHLAAMNASPSIAGCRREAQGRDGGHRPTALESQPRRATAPHAARRSVQSSGRGARASQLSGISPVPRYGPFCSPWRRGSATAPASPASSSPSSGSSSSCSGRRRSRGALRSAPRDDPRSREARGDSPRV